MMKYFSAINPKDALLTTSVPQKMQRYSTGGFPENSTSEIKGWLINTDAVVTCRK
jgi:hypothetical protein